MLVDELFNVQLCFENACLLEFCSDNFERAARGLARRNVTVAFKQLCVEFLIAGDDILGKLESCGFLRVGGDECGTAGNSARVSGGTFRIFFPELETYECDAAVFRGEFRVGRSVEQLLETVLFFCGGCGRIVQCNHVNCAFFEGNRQVACSIDDEFHISFRAVGDDTQVAEFTPERHHGTVGQTDDAHLGLSAFQSIEVLNGGIFCHVEFCTASMDTNHESNRKSVLDRLQFRCQEVVPCIDFVCDDEFIDGILFGVHRDHFVLLTNLLEFFIKVTLEPCHMNRGATQHTSVVGDSDRLEFCENASYAEDECRDECCFDDVFEIHCLILF